MKVSIYVRESGTRKLRKANRNEPLGAAFVLRYGTTWETIDAMTWDGAKSARDNREGALAKGWLPEPKPRQPRVAAPSVLMLDKAIDDYLAEIKAGRKPKTHAAYMASLRYFYECVGNKPMASAPTVWRADMLAFAAFLRDKKNQSPRSCNNKFENVLSFLKRHKLTAAALEITPHDRPQFVQTEPEMYDQSTLDAFFGVCDDGERLLFEFFLMTGMREQEVIYCTTRSLDFVQRVGRDSAPDSGSEGAC